MDRGSPRAKHCDSRPRSTSAAVNLATENWTFTPARCCPKGLMDTREASLPSRPRRSSGASTGSSGPADPRSGWPPTPVPIPLIDVAIGTSRPPPPCWMALLQPGHRDEAGSTVISTQSRPPMDRGRPRVRHRNPLKRVARPGPGRFVSISFWAPPSPSHRDVTTWPCVRPPTSTRPRKAGGRHPKGRSPQQPHRPDVCLFTAERVCGVRGGFYAPAAVACRRNGPGPAGRLKTGRGSTLTEDLAPRGPWGARGPSRPRLAVAAAFFARFVAYNADCHKMSACHQPSVRPRA